MSSIIWKEGGTTKFTFDKFNNFRFTIRKQIEPDEIPDTAIQGYWDDKIQDRTYSFTAELTDDSTPFWTQMNTLDTLSKTSDTLYNLVIDINGTTNTVYFCLSDITFDWSNTNIMFCNVNVKEADEVFGI